MTCPLKTHPTPRLPAFLRLYDRKTPSTAVCTGHATAAIGVRREKAAFSSGPSHYLPFAIPVGIGSVGDKWKFAPDLHELTGCSCIGGSRSVHNAFRYRRREEPSR